VAPMGSRRRHRPVRTAVLVALLSAVVPSAGQTQTAAFINARIIPVDGPPIERGTLVVQGGKIVAVGAATATTVPSGATVADLAGHTVMPGLVDTHSHIGAVSGGETDAGQPCPRASEAEAAHGCHSPNDRPGGCSLAGIGNPLFHERYDATDSGCLHAS